MTKTNESGTTWWERTHKCVHDSGISKSIRNFFNVGGSEGKVGAEEIIQSLSDLPKDEPAILKTVNNNLEIVRDITPSDNSADGMLIDCSTSLTMTDLLKKCPGKIAIISLLGVAVGVGVSYFALSFSKSQSTKIKQKLNNLFSKLPRWRFRSSTGATSSSGPKTKPTSKAATTRKSQIRKQQTKKRTK